LPGSCTRMRFAELDAVTVDGYGTLLRLIDPVPALQAALRERGLERSPEEVASAFAVEVAYYRPNAVRGRGPARLAELRRECVGIFVEAAGAELDPAEFVDAFIGALVFELVPGTQKALESLLGRGLALAAAANWDCSLHEHLERLGVDGLFSAVVTSAEAGAAKPDPAVLRLALERLGVDPGRALHVGDEDVDEQAARAAGMRFATAPLATAFAGWQ
jgi:putative hydrolase of the HAD superfamily